VTALVWFRSDLRVDDNTALSRACDDHRRVAAVFYATPQQWRAHDMGDARGDFLWRNLSALHEQLAALNIALQVRIVDRFADIAADLVELAKGLAVEAVHANREYPVNEVARDDAVAVALGRAGIALHLHHDATLLPPGAVLTRQGQPFKVFTPFKRALFDLVSDAPLQCLGVPGRREPWPQAVAALPPSPFVANPEIAGWWPAGEQAARDRLMLFINEKIVDYKQRRDMPALDGTSRLSPYLALGVLSIRRCIEAALAVNSGLWAGGNDGVDCWISELVWREFYIHVLAHFPQVCKYRAFRAETEQLRWRDDDNDFARWAEGRTGFPLVDAAMRQLITTGWMHNRLRMVTAMFLSKYLLLDWRRGERFFMQHLVDGDLAANNGGWQWSASTGTDAAPYFRVLNPLRQAERFDPDGEFTRRFLPALRNVDAKLLLQPGHPALLATGYPAPMVDLKVGRDRALAAFAATGNVEGVA
jgi:deoxyribodipyrimidine photo-lyase